MKTTLLYFALLIASSAASLAQLTVEQKLADFRQLANLYNKYYAPYEWKKLLTGFDMLDTRPWLDRVSKTKDDLDFYELCVEYVASLQDTHDAYTLPSNFVASLGMTVDIYDGKVLIDSITRSRLPASEYPFEVGDELVSVDGKTSEELINAWLRYAVQGNLRSMRRQTAMRLVTRQQNRMPRAHEIGESASVVIRRMNSAEETYNIPWLKTGLPVRVGPVPSPKAAAGPKAVLPTEETSDYMQYWMELQHSGVSEDHGVLNFGSRTPIFALPANFVQRLGRQPADFFYSGTYESGGYKIGYIRIPSYGTLSSLVQLLFDTEIAYLEENTDGLVVDEMRNPGGFLCFGENIVSRLVPYPFRSTGYELRAYWLRVMEMYNALNSARSQGADQWVIDLFESIFNQVYAAYRENRGRTGPVSLCSTNLERQPATDRTGRIIAYTKPLIMLADEFSTSTADSVPAMIQDAKRGPIFGYRTNGAGGTNTSFEAGAFSEGRAGMTLGLMTRAAVRSTPGYPDSWYIENVGVHPDIEYDYMTRENLLQRGRPFVDAFTAAIIEEIKKPR